MNVPLAAQPKPTPQRNPVGPGPARKPPGAASQGLIALGSQAKALTPRLISPPASSPPINSTTAPKSRGTIAASADPTIASATGAGCIASDNK